MGNISGKPQPRSFDGGNLHPNGIYPKDAQDFDIKIVQRLITQRLLAPFYEGAEDPDPSPGNKSSRASVDSDNNDTQSNNNNNDGDGWWSYRLHVKPEDKDEDNSDVGQNSRDNSKGRNSSQNDARESRPSTRSTTTELMGGRSGVLPTERQGTRASIATGASSKAALPTSYSCQPSSNPDFLRSLPQLAGSNKQNDPKTTVKGGSELTRPSTNSPQSAGGYEVGSIQFRRSVECPICFLYYPTNMNYSRCCHKPICTECFVQIKRSDELLSPAHCPYCVEPNFGVVYYPPRNIAGREVERPGHKKTKSSVSAMTARMCDLEFQSPRQSIPSTSRQRSKTLSDNTPAVIMSDDIRPRLLKQLTMAKERRERDEQRRSLAFAAIAATTLQNSQSSSQRSEGSQLYSPRTSPLQSVGTTLSRTGRRHTRRSMIRIPSEYGSYLAAMRASGGHNLEEFLIQGGDPAKLGRRRRDQHTANRTYKC